MVHIRVRYSINVVFVAQSSSSSTRQTLQLERARLRRARGHYISQEHSEGYLTRAHALQIRNHPQANLHGDCLLCAASTVGTFRGISATSLASSLAATPLPHYTSASLTSHLCNCGLCQACL